MYLKSIEVQGFKSFAQKMRLEFHNGITAIVGPNGSGKSNVADAVRWVLGEQSSRQLRGSSMQDVIFSGTELRKPLGYAYVAITLDNRDHALSIDYDEVTVSRRLYRSGESEYMINGSGCRLRDINELFYDTGVGKEGYSIIGQGQIDQILSSKPEDRRALFDEAAGIVKFKLRKAAAIRKLEDEKTNLVRVSDILSELEQRIAPLERQSEKAKVYLKTKEALKRLDVNLFLLDTERLRGLLQETQEKLTTASDQMQEAQAQHAKVRGEYDEASAQIEALDEQIEALRARLTNSSVMKEKLEGQIGILQAEIRAAADQDAHFREREKSLQAEIEAREAEQAQVLSGKQEIDRQLQSLTAHKEEDAKLWHATTEEIERLNSAVDASQATILDTLNERGAIRSRISSLATMREQNRIRRAELTSQLVRARTDETEQEETIRRLRAEFEQIGREIEERNRALSSTEEELSGMKETLSAEDGKLQQAQALYHQEKSKLEALNNLTERYEGYGGSVKRVMEQRNRERGIVGVVADIIKTKQKYETAIEIALGGNIQNIVTDDEETAKRMIAFLKETKGGRATFLPLSSITHPQEFTRTEALREPGVLGLADTLVDVDDKYRNVAGTLLGRIIVVDDVDHAVRLAAKYRHSLRIVTLAGELLVPGGAISGGAYRNSSNLLGRRRELAELEGKVKKYQQEIDAHLQNIADTKRRRNELRAGLEQLRSELQQKFIAQNTARLNVVQEEDKRKTAEGNYTALKTESDELEEKLQEIEAQEAAEKKALEESEETERECTAKIEEYQKLLAEKQETERVQSEQAAKWDIELEKVRQKEVFEQENLDRIARELDGKRADLREVSENFEKNAAQRAQKEQDVGEIRKTIESSAAVQSDAKRELDEKQKEKETCAAQQKAFFARREELSEEMSALDREINRLSVQKERHESGMESQISYMWEEYEITPSAAAKLRDNTLDSITSMKRDVAALKSEIRQLGDVNVGAIEEYRELMERYTFMKTQHDDLVKAGEQLRGIIEELDVSMRRQFETQFARINTAFDKVFQEMFGGGKGSLELVENEDILDAGIRIIAQPPGKKLQNMMQLSGGEKALTAIALLFAIQTLKPSPFCLLDEIEAALDENNVARFAKYLHKLGDTQFIVITHRRGTMESADRLYGITMQEKGVSALVSVNLIDKELTD